MTFIQKKYFQNLTVIGNSIYSYKTKVAKIDWNQENVIILGYFSQTTSKHINYVANELKFSKSLNLTKTFKITFLDEKQKLVFESIVGAVDLEDATNYANKMFFESKSVQCFTFKIEEL